MSPCHNIADRLRLTAQACPHQRAVVFPAGRDRMGRVTYSQLTFEQLDDESDRLARGLIRQGVGPQSRIVLMVRPGLEFIALTFALFKSGAIVVLIDPGMGRSNILRCLEQVAPEGFVAIPVVHVLRRLSPRRFRQARLNVTVGRRWFPKDITYDDVLRQGEQGRDLPNTRSTDPAAIIFTSGSTGPPKGVLYQHGMFNAQVNLLQDHYGIQQGEIDLPGFPLFALFNAAMAVTTVIPDMDPTRPADVDPVKILEAVRNQGVTQAFGSPALWNRVGRYCVDRKIRIPTLKRVLSAGAPVPQHVLKSMSETLQGTTAEVHTPYGATEALPICSISSGTVLSTTAEKTRRGAGTCVGQVFPGIQLKVIEIQAGPIAALEQVTELPTGQIGEIIVSGPVVTHEYYGQPQATREAKIVDGDRVWHRMGDVGYLDQDARLWFCGRKAHIVTTVQGPMYSTPCEAIFNNHPDVYRSALVGVGSESSQRPVIVVEPEQGRFPQSSPQETKLRQELLELGRNSQLTSNIESILFHESLPVDTRHNVKIFREKLAPWATRQLAASG
ncbi:MAG: fatty acid CoA ligase family protein [Planctomycetaceae bacterium]